MTPETNEKRLQQALGACDPRPFIEGVPVTPENGAWVRRKSPVDGRELPAFLSAGPSLVDQAVNSAERAFEQGRWSQAPLDFRRTALLRLADLMETHASELALLDSISMGKPVQDCLQKDIPQAARCLRWFAEAMDKYYDQCVPPRPNTLGTITREPLGVVAAICAWNYPMENLAWKIGPALAAGNSLVLKPAEQSTLSAARLARLALEAGIPAGVLNVVPGKGEETGMALALHPKVHGIFFTGSSATGKKILEYAGQSTIKRISLECGGKSAFLVLSGCRDLEGAARALARNIFLNQGQTCSAPSRLIVEKSVRERMLELVCREAGSYVPGNPLHPETRLGAMVSEEQLEKVLAYIRSGQEEGARLVQGGTRVHPVAGGAYLLPAIFDQVESKMKIAQEEIFGPVLSVITVANAEDALRAANDTTYGLAAAVWTDDLNSALGLSRKLRCGTVHVNSYGEDDMTAPFGGTGQSGNGFKEKSLFALDAYSNRKTTWFKTGI